MSVVYEAHVAGQMALLVPNWSAVQSWARAHAAARKDREQPFADSLLVEVDVDTGKRTEAKLSMQSGGRTCGGWFVRYLDVEFRPGDTGVIALPWNETAKGG